MTDKPTDRPNEAPYNDEITGPRPVPGQVEMRLRGRLSDVDALVDALSTSIPIAVTPRKHYRDADGKAVRRYVTVKPLYPGQAGEDFEAPTGQAEVGLRAFLVELARRDAGGFELFAAAVALADAMPGDEGRAKARDRFLDALVAEGSTS